MLYGNMKFNCIKMISDFVRCIIHICFKLRNKENKGNIYCKNKQEQFLINVIRQKITSIIRIKMHRTYPTAAHLSVMLIGKMFCFHQTVMALECLSTPVVTPGSILRHLRSLNIKAGLIYHDWSEGIVNDNKISLYNNRSLKLLKHKQSFSQDTPIQIDQFYCWQVA